MAPLPLAPTIQSLKYLIDVEPRAHLPSIFRPFDNLVSAEVWQEALIYAHDRLEPLEAEMIIFGERLNEIGILMGKQRELSFLQIDAHSKPMDRPQMAKRETVVTAGDEVMLRQCVVAAVQAKMSKRQVRQTWGDASNKWLMEGWLNGKLH